MKRISQYIYFLFCFCLLQGCIKEDLSKCNSELLLRFRYTLNNQYTNLFGSQVNRITVYIFDKNGKYVDTYFDEGSRLTNDYVMHISLPQGEYKAVALGGDISSYSVGELNSANHTLIPSLSKGNTDINNFRAELTSILGNDNNMHPLNIPNDLFVGSAESAISSPNNTGVTDIALTKDTKNIIVKIIGTDVSANPQNVYISAANGRYKYNNDIDTDHGTIIYTPTTTATQPNYMEADLKIMRLVLGEYPMLVIKDNTTQEIIYYENMIDLIRSTQQYTTQEDFDRQDVYTFEITISNNIIISVSINGWVINNIHPDM